MIRQSFLLVALCGLALVALVGCNAVTVGISCESRGDCAPGQDCFTAPNGFCTRGCTEVGRTTDCPSGTLCTFFGQSQVCSPLCDSNGDCRTNYVCAETGGTTALKACRPE
jgi:hypothetical protein